MLEEKKSKFTIDQTKRPEKDQKLIEKRYLQGEEKTWEDIVERVAKHAATTDKDVKDFSEIVGSTKFVPSRMTYMGTNLPFASSCFVFPVEDSLSGIMQTLSEACHVQKYGGGTGYNFSHLRPKGNLISTSGGDASGPVSFMGLYHNAMEVVHRAGKKHAAQMGILNCDHPNILEFIQCKDQEGAFWTFNISVAVTDDFMQAVKKDEKWNLKFGGKVYKTIQAKDLWNYIVQHAWHNGDPGVIFIDTVNRNNKYPEPIEACNPCGEQMLPPHVSCNLGSIDLSKFVVNGEVDWPDLERATRIALRFLDGSVAKAFWPVQKIQEKTHKYRNVGLGVMGWADMLILLGNPYDSEAAVELGEQVMEFINGAADDESKKLGGGTRKNITTTSIAPTGSISLLAGCSSGIEPIFGITTIKNTYVGTFKNTHWIFEQIAKSRGFYSEELLDEIAKTGSVQHNDKVPADVKQLFKTAMEIDWEWHVRHQAAFQKHTDNAVSKTINLPFSATVKDVEDAYFLAYETGCKSITVYRDGSRQVQVMENVQQEREMCPNCHAILFMKDGKKTCVTCGYTPSEQSTKATIKKLGANGEKFDLPSNITNETELLWNESRKPRPGVMHGSTYKMETPLGTAFVTINQNGDDQPFEAFITSAKAGSETAAVSEAIGRLISYILRLASPIAPRQRLLEIRNQLAGLGGDRQLGLGPKRVRSLPDGVSKVIDQYLQDTQEKADEQEGIRLDSKTIGDTQTDGHHVADQVSAVSETPNSELASSPSLLLTGELCPECGNATLVTEEGCKKCHSCGYSEC